MRAARRWPIVLAVICAPLVIAGCWATKKDVQQAVAASNAAMVAPYLAPPNETQADGWQQAVNQLDQLIAQNADQATLVNHLQVRAAMLFTVNREANLATLRWEAVDGSALTTERDRTLFANREGLVWWYERAGDPTPLDAASGEFDRVDRALQQLDASLTGVTDLDVRVLLETIRAQMVVRRVNSDPSAVNAAPDLAVALARFVAVFPPADQDWVRRDTTGVSSAVAEVPEMRRRVYLKHTIRLYRDVAADNGLSPTWSPSWVGTGTF